MNFSLEISPKTDIDTIPALKDVYITFLPGGDPKETAEKAGELVRKGCNPIPHIPARSIENNNHLKEYIDMCKDLGVKQCLVIGGSREPVGKFESSIQLLETGYFEGLKIGIAGHPEGSPDISDSELEKAMQDKKPYALDLMKPKDPNDIIGKLKDHTDHFHIYTFGGLKETNKWLMENNYV